MIHGERTRNCRAAKSTTTRPPAAVSINGCAPAPLGTRRVRVRGGGWIFGSNSGIPPGFVAEGGSIAGTTRDLSPLKGISPACCSGATRGRAENCMQYSQRAVS